MGKFIKGDVIVIPFPFSDLSQSKKRPALIIQTLSGDDVILAQITSQAKKDKYSKPLFDEGFKSGRLNKQSNIRPNHIFTADSNIILYKIGHLKKEKIV
jgi:mRNA interferase MazF